MSLAKAVCENGHENELNLPRFMTSRMDDDFWDDLSCPDCGADVRRKPYPFEQLIKTFNTVVVLVLLGFPLLFLISAYEEMRDALRRAGME